MKPNKPKVLARSLAELKHLRKQAELATRAAPAPVQAQKRQRPRPPDPGQASTPSPGMSSRQLVQPASPEPALSPEDRALLRQAYAQVTPLSKTNSVQHAVFTRHYHDPLLQERRRHAEGAPTPNLVLTPVSDQYTSALAENNDSHYRNPACGTDVVRNLVKGKWPIAASMDLHGANLDEARERLDNFLSSCLEHQIKCVRIVHGVGYGSKGDPLLPRTVRLWLQQLDAVLSYVECAEHEGGQGAVKVLLRTLHQD